LGLGFGLGFGLGYLVLVEVGQREAAAEATEQRAVVEAEHLGRYRVVVALGVEVLRVPG
jgi:hypothetical protein